MKGPVQPPYANPPAGSSPACPGACTTPSSDTYSTTASFLIKPAPYRFPLRNEHRPGAGGSARQNDRQITGSFGLAALRRAWAGRIPLDGRTRRSAPRRATPRHLTYPTSDPCDGSARRRRLRHIEALLAGVRRVSRDV